MIGHYIMIVLSAVVSVLIYLLTGQYKYDWYVAFFIPLYYVGAYFILICLYILFLSCTSLILNKRKARSKPNKFYYGIIRETAIIGLFFSRCKVKKVNTKLEPKKKYLLICNHQSNYDPIIAFKCLRTNPLIMVTKPENMNILVAGQWIRYSGFIPIARDDIKEAANAISTATKYINEKKASICIYPEGRRNFDEGLLDFHPGSFKIAYRSKCPIVISSLKDSKEIKNNLPLKRTKVRFSILKVLEYEEYKEMNTTELANYARDLILEDLSR